VKHPLEDKTMRWSSVRAGFAGIALACCGLEARAAVPAADANYPSRPIRIIVPFAPGGTNDILGRMIATHLTEKYGRPVIVDNRPGAEGIVGTELGVKATPDGYTLVVLSAAYVMNPAIRKLPYDPNKALEFIAKLGQGQTVLVVGPALPVNSLKEYLAAAKAKPGQIVLAQSGGFQHFAALLFNQLSGQKFNIVLYKGAFPALIDVIGGQAHSTIVPFAPSLPHLRSGKIKGLGVGSIRRAAVLPDMPTFDELGLTGYDASNWYSIAAPLGTPREIVAKLYNDIASYLRTPDTVKRVAAMGAEVDVKPPEELRKIVPAEIAKWTKVAIDAGIPRELN
jgi:tripartite-type tricarboxylate transporter receptor subunit TctC